MATKREQILAAISSTLAGTTGVNTRIYRSRQEAFSRQEAPAIVIAPSGDNPAPEPVSSCKIDWTLTVQIAVYARGNVPDQVADPVILSLHSKLMADRTLGGLVMDIYPDLLIRSLTQAIWRLPGSSAATSFGIEPRSPISPPDGVRSLKVASM